MMQNTFTIGEALRFGWGKYKSSFLILSGGVLLTWVANFILQLTIGGDSPGERNVPGLVATIAMLIFYGFELLINMGLIRIALNLHDNLSVSFSMLFSAYDRLLKFFVVGLVYGIMITIGLILLIIPGLYIAVRFFFAQYAIVDRNTGIMEAFTESSRLTDGVRMKLFGFFVVILLVNIVGALLIGIGLLVTIPITMLATAYVYRKLQQGKEGGLATVVQPVMPPDEKSAPAVAA